MTSTPIDHLIYAAPRLEEGVETVHRMLGVRPAAGGQHPGWGTANALLRLGAACYLEVIGPDLDQPEPSRPRPFGIDQLMKGQLVGWAVKANDLEARLQRSAQQGYLPGDILPGRRRRPDETLLQWRLVLPESLSLPCEGLIPFLIDWQGAAHPSTTAPPGCTLVALHAEHPNRAQPQAYLDALGVALSVAPGPVARLRAVIDTPSGRVELV